MVEKISGIYRIVCVKNGRYYYGSSKNIYKRWNDHKSGLRRGNHTNPVMQNIWNKWGEITFHIELIEEAVEDKLREVEQTYLDDHVGNSNCMNILSSATEPPNYWSGKTRSLETRKKLSEAAKKQHREGRVCKFNAEQRKKISDKAKERHKSLEYRRRISKWMMGNQNARKN